MSTESTLATLSEQVARALGYMLIDEGSRNEHWEGPPPRRADCGYQIEMWMTDDSTLFELEGELQRAEYVFSYDPRKSEYEISFIRDGGLDAIFDASRARLILRASLIRLQAQP